MSTKMDKKTARAFVTAGNATITLKSLKTGKHLVYKVVKPNENTPHFVRVKTGNDYTRFVGTIFSDGNYHHGRQTNPKSTSAQAWRYFWEHLNKAGDFPDELEVRHEGRCGRCGRPLTDPESQDRGIGPVCASKMGLL
jgi:hypothetical protein